MNRAPEITAQAFFKIAQPHSVLKADIVSKYVIAWANIIIRGKLHFKKEARAYVVDLFSGCGQYEDGTKSTPIKIIDEALKADHLRENLILRFNDNQVEMIERLQGHVAAIPGVTSFKNKIGYSTYDAESPEVLSWFTKNNQGPRLPMVVFIDPFGYKEISRELLRSMIQIPQSDILFFFNYRRVNAALGNEQFESNMNKIFGPERVQRIKTELATARPAERSEIIIRHLDESLREIGANFVVPFVVVQEDEEHISHYIVGITKHEKGFELMKKVLKQHTTIGPRSRAKFGHDLASVERDKQHSMFDALPDPIGELAAQVYQAYTGRIITFGQLYKQHHPTAHYTESEYKQAVRRLLLDKRAYALDEETKPSRKTIKGEQAVPEHLSIRFM
ncbi:three-Cys-motif partner protein TcmP [Hymenobacter rubripertinctus]|uniref:Three-Cys-motif partner protein TcmP n=1 Tax=Hymenobacter rubripertinctus TaxID=2029981 RepID=A0A418QJA3_9BACT|nr:three-Cys-motif partner protein TcmP [Hymenobacter rubripertinctus]RIY05222.1 three-Cys-motif partner protein TcmP [Hymenobacter rubripertinctus]